MMKTLLVDLENGYKSIGSKETIEEKFGLPLLNFNDFTSFRNFIGQLWSRKKVEKEVKVGEVSVVQSSYEIIAKEGVDVDCMVIDTASEMSKKYARELKGKAEQLQLKQWGKLKDTLEPQMLSNYLYDLAALFHKYYAHNRIITENMELSKARLVLIKATKIVIKNGLNILGISAPKSM